MKRERYKEKEYIFHQLVHYLSKWLNGWSWASPKSGTRIFHQVSHVGTVATGTRTGSYMGCRHHRGGLSCYSAVPVFPLFF